MFVVIGNHFLAVSLCHQVTKLRHMGKQWLYEKCKSRISRMKTTSTKKLKRLENKKIPSAAVVITIMASVVLAVWQIPAATAISLEEIGVSREISAPIDQVWRIVSDIDNETKYWPTFKAIKNIDKTGNTTEREVTLIAGPQGETKTHQIVTVNPRQFLVG